MIVFFFNDTATTEIYTLSLHDALPISRATSCARGTIVVVGRTPNQRCALVGSSTKEVRFIVKSLRDASVVITGASSGIGLATAHAFARHGANVVLAARRHALLEEGVQECGALGGRALAVPTDVTDRSETRELASAAASAFGGIDIWINNEIGRASCRERV